MNSSAIVLYLSKHFRDNVQLSDLAREANLSKFHFHRLFTAELGITPQQYLEKLRVEHAAHFMIVNTHATLQEVAFESGYSSPATFSRSFRKQFAMAPTKYRASHGLPFYDKPVEIKKVAVQYLNSQTVPVIRVNLADITQEYQQFIKQNAKFASAIGFFIDAPFHISLADCRHFVGSELFTDSNQTMTISSGYYTSLKVTGGFEELRNILTDLKFSIEASGYFIDTLSAFERIQIPPTADGFDYFSAERELFLKVKRQ